MLLASHATLRTLPALVGAMAPALAWSTGIGGQQVVEDRCDGEENKDEA